MANNLSDKDLIAALLSMILPGLGQAVKEKYAWGLAVFAGSIAVGIISALFVATIILLPVGILLPLGYWAWNVYDAATLKE